MSIQRDLIDQSSNAVRTISTSDADSAVKIDNTSFILNSDRIIANGAYAADPTSLSTISNGNIGVLKMDTSGRLITTNGTLTAGEDQNNDVQGVIQKPVASSIYSFTVDQSSALEASSVIKPSAGNLFKLGGRIDSTAGTGNYYVQLIDSATVPANGPVSLLIAPLKIAHTTGTDSAFDFDITPNAVHGASGLVWCISTTEFTKTVAGAVASATALYK